MFRVLFVEDEDHVAGTLEEALATTEDLSVTRVGDRRTAEDLLTSDEHFDLVVCDLRIPAFPGGLDTAAQHGLAVHSTSRRMLPGSPVLFLTGVAEDNLDDLVDATSAADVTDVLRNGQELRMVQLFRKDRLWACIQEIKDVAERLARIDGMPIESAVALEPLYQRAVVLSALQWNPNRIDVSSIGGGLSSAATLHANVFDEHELHRASTFLKIASLDDCRDELSRFEEFISGKLAHQAFPDVVRLVRHCLGRMGCLVYKFADDWDTSLFGKLAEGIDGEAVVPQVRDLMSPWETMRRQRSVLIQDLRRHVITDEDYWEAVEIEAGDRAAQVREDLEQFERTDLEAVFHPQHGDLHGENVLLDAQLSPTLIDCGDVGLHPSGLDALTLELSLLFHPAATEIGLDLPGDVEAWMDVDEYAAGLPHEDYIRSCRDWATEVADDLQVLAIAYQYVARQMKYPDTPKALALEFAQVIAGHSRN